MDDLARGLSDQGFRVTVLPEREVPPEAYDARRRQYRAGTLVDLVRSGAGDRVLAVTALDLYADDLNFVFGLAESPGAAAVVSLYRLRAGADARLLRERALKEAVHELGHTFGLPHCPDARCVMHFSNRLVDTDQKRTSFCSRCTRVAIATRSRSGQAIARRRSSRNRARGGS
jgi:archaemetzincin